MTIKDFIDENKEEIKAHIKSVCSNCTSFSYSEIRMWLDNDEGLYNWARSCGVNL